MCENDDFDEFARHPQPLTRRTFCLMTLGAGLVAAFPGLAATSAETKGQDVTIKTPAGTADAYFVHPDIFGLRPAFKDMATRLAQSGYAVLVINPFYRTQHAPTAAEHADLDDPATRKALMALHDTLTPDTNQVDAKAFVAFLDHQPAVDTRRKLGTMGYCMGGPQVFVTAANIPDRIGAAATFHGGGLATDKPESPHLLIPRMKAQFLIAIAASDDTKDPKATRTVRDAFAKAKLPAEIEVYAGTKHGWCPTDSAVYDHDQAEKAWGRMLVLFGRALAG
jgi:carboxymethylenebutenolidase